MCTMLKKSIFSWTYNLLIISSLCCTFGRAQTEENDSCETIDYKGICATSMNCPYLRNSMETLGLNRQSVGHCGFTIREEIICCPQIALLSATTSSPTDFTTISSQGIRDLLAKLPADQRKQKFKDLMKDAGIGGGGGGGASTTNESKSKLVRAAERPADRACREIEKQLMPSSVSHILGGDPVASPSQYPHMVDIVYDDDTLKCGGTLIDKRFVLTAAHCIEVKGAKAIKVRLGVTNYNDTVQLRGLVEMDIKTTYVHENYSSVTYYNDIGVIELVKDAEYKPNVYPTCLHTSFGDLSENTELVVTGWGRTEQQIHPTQLMATTLNYVPTVICNASYVAHINRRLNHGIDGTQLCAFALGKDACWGDSGGPIHLVEDQSFNNYRVVGVVSFGLICGSATPGVYTRVAAYLDFIESIVWPEAF